MRLAVLLLVLLIGKTGVAATDPIGSVANLQGSAWAVSGGKTTELKVGQVIHSGEHIRTGLDSRAILKLGTKDSAVMLKAMSEITLRQTPSGDWMAMVGHGGALFRIKNPEHRPRHFTVNTRVAVMGARGTTFFVEAPEKGPVFFCDCTGSVEVSDPHGGTELFTSEHHDHPTDIASGEGALAKRLTPTQRPATQYDHSDADAAELDQAIDAS